MRISSVNTFNYQNKFYNANKKRQQSAFVLNQNMSNTFYNISFGDSLDREEQEKIIFSEIQKMKSLNEPITCNIISKRTGIPLPSVYQRAKNNPELFRILFGAEYIPSVSTNSTTPKNVTAQNHESSILDERRSTREQKALQMQREKEKIRVILQEAKDNGVNLSISQISKMTGISNTAIQARICSDGNLYTLFQDVKIVKSKKYTMEEREEQTKQIFQILTNAQKSGFSISIEQMSQTLGINAQTVYKRIDDNSQLKNLWNLVGQSGSLSAKAKIEYEINLIKTELEQALKEEKRLTIEEISQKTKIPSSTLSTRIYQNRKLSQLIEQMRQFPFEKSPNITAKEEQDSESVFSIEDKQIMGQVEPFKSKIILGMIAEAKLKNKPIPYKSIIQSTGASKDIIDSFEKIYEHQTAQAKKNPQQSTTINDYIIPQKIRKQESEQKVIKMILDAKRSGRQISYSAITKATGVLKDEIDRIISDYKTKMDEYKRRLEIENAKALETLQKREEERLAYYTSLIPQEPPKKPQIQSKPSQKTEQPLKVTEIQYKKTGLMLKQAQDNGYRIPLSSIAQSIHVDEKTAFKILKTRPDLLEIWQQVKAPETLSKPGEDE